MTISIACKKLCLLLFLSISVIAAFPEPINSSWLWDESGWLVTYDSRIGNTMTIRLTLKFDDKQIQGKYFYLSTYQDIRLSGTMGEGRTFTLNELDDQGDIRAHFIGNFPALDPEGNFGTSPLQREVLVGTWEDLRTKKTYSFYLHMTYANSGDLSNRYARVGADNEDVIDHAARQFLDAFKNGDRLGVAKLISYPFRVNLIGGGQRTIKTPKEFLRFWNKIYSPDYYNKHGLSRAIPKHMMVTKYDQVMLSSGGPFFGADGKIVSLGNY